MWWRLWSELNKAQQVTLETMDIKTAVRYAAAAFGVSILDIGFEAIHDSVPSPDERFAEWYAVTGKSLAAEGGILSVRRVAAEAWRRGAEAARGVD